MISPEAILKITCPSCGAGPGAPCMKGSRGQVLATQHPSRIGRAIEDRDFWRYVDEELRKNPGLSEQEFLDKIRMPGWTGRKARTAPAPRVVPMPPARDGKKAAAGDYDDAA